MMSGTKLVVFDLNNVLTDETLAVKLLAYKPEASTYFKLYGIGYIGERDLVIEASKEFKGLPKSVIEKEAYNIVPRLEKLDLIGWETAIVSLDYFELVKRIACMLEIPYYYGNRIVYENGVHSGRVEDPVLDFEQKKIIISSLRDKLTPNLVVGIDDKNNSPFKEVCDSFFLANTKEELKFVLAKIRAL